MCGTAVQSGHSTLTDNNGTFQRTGTTYADPYANTSMPAFSGCDHTNFAPVSGGTTSSPVQLSPGVYCGGLAINGGNINLAPGTYIINGTSSNAPAGLQINGNAVVDCSACDVGGSTDGVTFVLTGSGSSSTSWASVQINGTAQVNLTAPRPGATSGMNPFLFYQDRNIPADGATTAQFNGNAVDAMTGAMYFPNQKVIWNGNSNDTGKCTQLIVYQLQFNGTNNFQSDAFNCKDLGIKSLNAPGGVAVALVE